MPHLNEIVIFIIGGISAVTLIDVIGSITSRTLNYTYAYLTPLSLIVYVLTGFFVSQFADLNSTLLATCLIGVYDGTVGWKLSIFLKANFGKFRDSTLRMTLYTRIIGMIGLSIFCGFIGYILKSIIK